MAKPQTKLTPRKVLSVENVVPVIVVKKGNLAAVARAFGIRRQAVHQFVQAHPELLDVVAEVKESAIDMAEDALQKAIRKGEGWAVCFFLKTQARHRGYGQNPPAPGDDEPPLYGRAEGEKKT